MRARQQQDSDKTKRNEADRIAPESRRIKKINNLMKRQSIGRFRNIAATATKQGTSETITTTTINKSRERLCPFPAEQLIYDPGKGGDVLYPT